MAWHRNGPRTVPSAGRSAAGLLACGSVQSGRRDNTTTALYPSPHRLTFADAAADQQTAREGREGHRRCCRRPVPSTTWGGLPGLAPRVRAAPHRQRPQRRASGRSRLRAVSPRPHHPRPGPCVPARSPRPALQAAPRPPRSEAVRPRPRCRLLRALRPVGESYHETGLTVTATAPTVASGAAAGGRTKAGSCHPSCEHRPDPRGVRSAQPPRTGGPIAASSGATTKARTGAGWCGPSLSTDRRLPGSWRVARPDRRATYPEG